MGDAEEPGNHERFFSVKQADEKRDSGGSVSLGSRGSDEGDEKRFRTLRIIQQLLPCLKRKGVWEPSQGDVFKSHDAEEIKYPKILRILENRVLESVFIFSCVLSIYLFLFSEGFLLKSRLLWGIIHFVNAVYAMGLFCQWLQILIKSKYAKTNHGYTTRDIVFTLLSVFPADLVILAIYTLNDDGDDDDTTNPNPVQEWMITVSRLNYFLRIRNIMQYFSKWEDHLVIGDFRMFLMRTAFFATFLIHLFACIWHRLACNSFELSHFLMTADEATVEVCNKTSWIGQLKMHKQAPLLDHPDWNVLVTHYLVSLYWTVIATFRLGASDIKTTLASDKEVAFLSITEITAWIFAMTHVSGTLASLLIEKETEKQNFLTRCFAIRYYLQSGNIARSIQEDVTRFYAYLWERSSGILNLDLVDVMPHAMRSEVFHDVNKFVLDQLPILKGLDTPFLMSLSVVTNHRFFMSGEVLFRRNETAYGLYYLVKGHLEILSEDEGHAITTIRSGSAIGELHLLQPYLHVATVRCGSDCEIRILSRKHFRQVLNIYPQYEAVLEQRLENRLEQCSLLLTLCEKHNTYQRAFKALREFKEQDTVSVNIRRSELGHSFENITKILSPLGLGYENIRQSVQSYDFDGLTLSSDMEERLNRVYGSTATSGGGPNTTNADTQTQKAFEEMLAKAYESLETDVARAGSLANDLNIPRPPMFVTAPETSTHVTLGFNQRSDAENVCVSLFRQLKEPKKGKLNFAWKLLVSSCAIFVFWYYPYRFGFHYIKPLFYSDYLCHLADIIFAMDCFYDMIQMVVTPLKTFESAKEITLYRLKSFYFYMRLVSFIPFEYFFKSLVGNGADVPYFYLLKFNRLLELHLVYRFMHEFENRFRLKPIITGMGLYVLGLFYVAHIFTVLNAFVKDGERIGYRRSFHWALVVVTSLGYGDYPATNDKELLVEVVGLIVGVSSLVYLSAKVTATLVNGERKRISFKQTFYALDTFMKQRKFPKLLSNRVTSYYSVQWRAHQGTLVPTGKSVIWDAPKSVISRVCHAQAHKYVCRIPLFLYCTLNLQNEICVALKQYLIPPGEVLLHPSELARDLYIISKGYVEVTLEGSPIAVFTEGRYFGLNGLLYGVNTQYMFKTITHCQLFCLTHEAMMKVAASKPNFLRELDLISGVEKMTPFQNLNSSEARGSELPPYPSRELLDKLLQLELTSMEESETRREMTSMASYMRNFRHGVRTSFGKFYLLPNGNALRWWMVVRLTFVVFTTIFAAAQIAFPVRPTTSVGVIALFDLVAWIDIMLSLRIAYYGDRNQIVTDSWKMAKHYLQSNFIVDLVACFPADFFLFVILQAMGNYDSWYHVVAVLRVNRMLQCYKLILTNGILEKIMFKSLSLVMLLEMAPLMFIFINLTTCFTVLRVCGVANPNGPIVCSDRSWILNGLKRLNYDDVLQHAEAHELDDTNRLYLIGLYWVSQSVLSVGYGDIEIGNDFTNQIVGIMTIFIGISMASYAGGKLTSCMVGDDPAKIELQEKMTLMNSYLEQQRASRNLRRRTRETYLNAWEKTKGVTPTNLFLALPPTLKTDVMKQLYGSTLKLSPLFENLDGPGIRMLSSSLQEIFYPEGEFLMKFGDLSSDIFFIANGVVVCYNVRGIVMCQLGGGSIIGNTAAFFRTHRLYTAIAVKDVNAYMFRKEAFMNFLNQYPQIKTVMETCSVKHYREAMTGSKKADAMDYEVLLTYQNERLPESMPVDVNKQGVGDKQILENAAGRRFDYAKLSMNSSSVSSDASSVSGDLTRIPLKEDVLKGPEELSKTSAERWWSTFITFGRMARDEMGLVHIYQEQGQCNIFNFTVHPSSSICNWVSIFLIITAISCSITAYEISFSKHNQGTVGVIMFRNVLELFFIIRIAGNFHLGFYDETATLITNTRTISKRYMSRVDGLFLDVVTTFPFYLISELFGNETVYEYVRGLQLLRVIIFLRYLQETASNLNMKTSFVKILKITVLLCFIFHFWACVWYLAACYNSSCSRGSWMHKILSELAMTEGLTEGNVTISSRYLFSLFYVSNALTATGFSSITARTNIELCLSITMMFGTVFVIGFLVGDIAQCLASQVATKIHYQHRLIVLENHFTSLGISYEKMSAIREYFKLFWCRCKGVMLYNLMEELPYSLRADVAFEIYGPNLRSSRILGKLDENLIRQICARVRHQIYFPGSHIVRAGDVCTSMFFIKKGEVVILDGNSNLDLCVEILYESECFGEVKILLPKEQYRFSYIARLESEVGVLTKDDLEAVLMHHPRIFEEVRDKANKVKARRQSVKEEEEKGSTPQAASTHSIKTGVSNEKK